MSAALRRARVVAELAGHRASQGSLAGREEIMGHIRLRSLLLLVALAGSSMGSVAPTIVASSDAASIPQRCTMGDAEAVFQALPVTAGVMKPRGQDHPGLLEASFECQYRVWFDGESYTFCEDDVIVGGIVYFWEYKALGIARDAAIADMELLTSRVWLDGVEQDLRRTTYKNANFAGLGLSVYQHRAFITQLAAGDYVSVWVETYPGLPDNTAMVNIHVQPRELCA